MKRKPAFHTLTAGFVARERTPAMMKARMLSPTPVRRAYPSDGRYRLARRIVMAGAGFARA
jgi:hypothetical protein